MKRIVGLLLTAILIIGMGTAVCASPSKSTTVSDTTTSEGAKISHIISDELATAAGIEDGKISTTEQAKIKSSINATDLRVLDVFNVEAPTGYVEGTPIKITIPGITWQEGMVILHFQDGAWVELPTTHDGDKVQATFTKFSPTAVAIVSRATAMGAAGTTDKSPKTGETNTVLFITIVALVVGCTGYAILRKKRA